VVRLPGLGPDSALARWVSRLSAGRLTPSMTRVATMVAAFCLAFGLVAMVLMVQLSSTPTFCGSVCHIMKPYYQSWKHSSHNRVACVECHIAPGVNAEVRKKWEAMSMVAKYVTATYGDRPWAEVEDAACLRCHERRLLEGREIFHNVVFDHRPHLTETRRGMKLRCTSCHSQMVQGTHIAVTPSTCALCHFKGQKTNSGTAACLKCHEIPQKVVTSNGSPFDHSQVAKLGMDCQGCHAAVVRGDGVVPKERCLSCHNTSDRLERYNQPDLLHLKHVTEHKVDCSNCHLEIQHGQLPPEQATAQAASACERCHGSGHSPQTDLYSGRGGRGVPVSPSPMFVAGVTCEGCHDTRLSDARVAATETGVHSARASDVSCMVCHGPKYEGLYQAWKISVSQRSEALRRQLDVTIGAMGVVPPQAFEDAKHNYLLVERGHGVHNVSFSYALLDKAHDLMNEARHGKGLAPLAKPWTVIAPNSAACLSCHMGIEKQAGAFAGKSFAHAPHLGAAKLECGSCHRPHAERAPGEVVKFGPGGCAPCHHRGNAGAGAQCITCHGDVTKRTLASWRGEFSHSAHIELGLECGSCHTGGNGDPKPAKTVCSQCHVE